MSSSKSIESILRGLDIVTKNPNIFIPALAPLIIHLLFAILAYITFPLRYHVYIPIPPYHYEEVVPNTWLLLGGYFIASIVGFIASCVIVDMANDAINGRPMNLNKSLSLVMGKLGTLILAAIISAICFITFILIPVALFIITIAIIEGTDAIQSTKNAADFVVKNLGEVIIFIIIVAVTSIVFGLVFMWIPIVGVYIGSIIMWIVNVIFTVASVYFYLALRQPVPTAPPPPPPSPPPPPVLY
ncbi:hypothetical protein KEJ32_05840 [Candidatus Bathyarchaeota archaeon]|nr:hypothetical protein [Candidatus Bathyarchaeota archaeon]